jgi:hypothetical protein
MNEMLKIHTLKIMKDMKVKQIVLEGWVPVGRERVNGETKRGRIWSMYIVYIYENRAMKPAEIILRKGARKMGKMMAGVNLIKLQTSFNCMSFSL